MRRRGVLASLLLSLWGLVCAAPCPAADPTAAALQQQFRETIRPWLEAHCLDCHGSEAPEADLDLAAFSSLDSIARGHQVWQIVMERVAAGEMPPTDTDSQPSSADRERFLQWIQLVRRYEGERHAGDPGPVLVRRLSNVEYDHCIRDLTGFDIRPTSTFPVDPANESGFDNSGESLSMSPALMNKYLQAARTVVEHLVLTPDGIGFAPHPVVTDTDRDKYCVKRIVEFYQRQPTDYADYFFAAWQFRQVPAAERNAARRDALAMHQQVSAKYLAVIWKTLTDSEAATGPLGELQRQWLAIPDDAQPGEARDACRRLSDFVAATRREFEPTIDNLDIDGVHKGSQPFVLWKNKQYAALRRVGDPERIRAAALAALAPPESQSTAEPQSSRQEDSGQKDVKQDAAGQDETEEQPNEASQEGADGQAREALAAAARAVFEQDLQRFCSVFPDAFYISERGRDYLGTPRAEQEKGRLLSAGFHSMMGYFRDDTPLMELILDEAGRAELDRLWQELDFFTAAPQRQYQGFLWFERTDSRFMRDAEFDFARAEDQAALTAPMIQQLAETYIAKATRQGGSGVPLQAIRDYFVEINDQIRWVEQSRLAAEPKQLEAVIQLADRAYRRPLSRAEQEDLRDFYHVLRQRDGLSHEEALQDTLVSILMSPNFCYRLDLLRDSPQPRALDAYELASRLSFFLWSSQPDAELLAAAQSGALTQPPVLLAQVDRMLHDARVRGLATEFAGNWLDIRRFEEHNSVDRQRFPSFDDALRAAMFEEPMRFFVDLLHHDRSALDLLYADRTFVNRALAKHYGLQELEFDGDEWVAVHEAGRVGRGGLLPMAVFLTKNAPGLRTSPVKRGYWLAKRILGEFIPPPPPNVPELPQDEAELGELTLRETLARHREHASCAGCHNRIDSLGLVFEEFGPVGERRDVDLGGRPIDALATFPDGSQRNGVAELREYLREQREDDFLDNLCRKLLAYALGRSLVLSDELLIESMQAKLREDDFRFNALIETIVSSPQFLNKRGWEQQLVETPEVDRGEADAR